MACVRTYATLRIFSRTTGPDELSEILGIQPTKTRAQDPLSRRPVEREFSMWALSTKASLTSTDGQEHIDWLLNRMDESRAEFARLISLGCLMDVFCYFEIDGQGGPSLTSGQMGRLSELGLDVTWDIYSGSSELESEEGRATEKSRSASAD